MILLLFAVVVSCCSIINTSATAAVQGHDVKFPINHFLLETDNNDGGAEPGTLMPALNTYK